MMAYEGKTARQAIDELRSLRGGSVEGPQERNVLEFEAEALKGWSSRAPTPRNHNPNPAMSAADA